MGAISADYLLHGRHHPAPPPARRADRDRAELSEVYGLRVANVFHAGDGNLHPLILYDANQPGELDRGRSLRRRTSCGSASKVGGVLTGEHGVGIEKRDLMPVMFTEVDLAHQQR